MSEEQFYDLLSRKLSGDATAEECALLQEQLLQHPEWQFLYDQMIGEPVNLCGESEHTLQAYAAHMAKMQLAGVLSGEENPELPESDAVAPVTSHWRRKLAYSFIVAACLASVIIWRGALIVGNVKETDRRTSNEIFTKNGSKSTVKLPDGTKVWLNADSKLTYGGDFNVDGREVTLVGEAYFDVCRDRQKPFVIHAGVETIRVLGTAFNVRNYAQDESLETTVLKGAIEISFADGRGGKIVLRPNEKLIFSKEKDSFYKTATLPLSLPRVAARASRAAVTDSLFPKDSVVAETAWLVDKMVFVNQPLATIARELERNFAITVIFKNPRVSSYRYTGVFDNLDLKTILEILQASKKINYQISGKTLIIQ